MSRGVPVVSIEGRRRRVGKSCWQVTGKLGLSANSTFVASGIEKQFRKCTHIQVSVGSAYIAYMPSTTKGNGILQVCGSTQTTGRSLQIALDAATSATFMATGM